MDDAEARRPTRGRSWLRVALLVATLHLFFPGTAAAQAGQEAGPGAYPRVISINPIALVVFGAFSVEYEQQWGRNTSWGGSISYYDHSRWTYFSFDAKARYYLEDRALDGLSVGFLAGFTSGRNDETDASGNAIGIGFTAENQWLFGEDERLAVTLGVGGKRLFHLTEVEDAPNGLPLFRLSLGWAF